MLKEEDIQLCMPVFYVETTTKPISALAKVSKAVAFNHYDLCSAQEQFFTHASITTRCSACKII